MAHLPMLLLLLTCCLNWLHVKQMSKNTTTVAGSQDQIIELRTKFPDHYLTFAGPIAELVEMLKSIHHLPEDFMDYVDNVNNAATSLPSDPHFKDTIQALPDLQNPPHPFHQGAYTKHMVKSTFDVAHELVYIQAHLASLHATISTLSAAVHSKIVKCNTALK
jgi:hypothetical protein